MRIYRKRVTFIFLLLIVIIPLHSQVTHSHGIVVSFLQFKDEFSLGMVFNGVRLEYRYGLHWKINDHEILFQPKISAGAAFNRGMTGAQIYFSPVNITWTMPFFENNEHSINGGVNFIMDYNYQYTELNDGPIFWTSIFGFSPVIRYSYQWDNKRIYASLQNSLFGFTSRRQDYDPYEWVFTWRDFVINPHKDLKFGSFNDYNHTKVSLEFVPNIDKIHSLAYEFDYLGIFYGYRFDQINHNLLWRMSL